MNCREGRLLHPGGSALPAAGAWGTVPCAHWNLLHITTGTLRLDDRMACIHSTTPCFILVPKPIPVYPNTRTGAWISHAHPTSTSLTHAPLHFRHLPDDDLCCPSGTGRNVEVSQPAAPWHFPGYLCYLSLCMHR